VSCDTWWEQKNYGLHYTGHEDGRPTLVGYNDTDMAGDVNTHKSTSGIIFFLGGNPVTWQSTKQRVMALSSCEAKYVTVASAVCQGVWLARLLTNLIGEESGVPELRIDNQSAIVLCKNLVFHNCSKHIDVRYHYIRECVEEDRIIISYAATAEQLVDILTKALGRVRFHELRVKIGIVSAGCQVRDWGGLLDTHSLTHIVSLAVFPN
jgi:hypothetical protein